jgi:HK97 family phage major capsid protein
MPVGANKETKTKQRAAREVLEEAVKNLAGIEATTEEHTTTIKSISDELTEIKSELEAFDVKRILSEIERIKAGYDDVTRGIQRATGLTVSGAADYSKDFSLIRAIVSAKTNGKKFGDTQEFELMKQYRERAAQVMGIESDGGWFVSDEIIPEVIGAIYRKSVLVDLQGDGVTRARLITGLTGASVSIPKFNGGAIAYWGGELDAAAVTAAKTGNINMRPRKLNCMIRLSDEMQRFQAFAFETYLRQDMVRSMSQEMDRAMLFGTGGNDEPEGITNLGIQQYIAGGDAAVHAELDWSGLSEGMDILIEEADLEEDDTFATISAPRYFKRISNLRTLNFSGQDSGQPYLAGLPPLTQARLTELIGDFGRTTAIASNKDVGDGASKATDVIRGNFGEMLVGRWGGLEVVTEDGYDITDDSRLVKIRGYADSNIRYEKALVHCPNAKARA